MGESGASRVTTNGEAAQRSDSELIEATERANFISMVTGKLRGQRVRKDTGTSTRFAEMLLIKTVDAKHAQVETRVAAYNYEGTDIECSVMGDETVLTVTKVSPVRQLSDDHTLFRSLTTIYETRPGEDWYDEEITYLDETGARLSNYIPREGDNLFGQTLKEAEDAAARRKALDDISMDALIATETPSLRPVDTSAHAFTVGRYREAMALLALCTDATYIEPRTPRQLSQDPTTS